LITAIPIAAAISLNPIDARASVSELDHELYRELHRGPQRPTLPPAQPTPETLACYERLTKIAHFVPVATPAEPAQCAVSGLVRLEHVRMSDQTRVAIMPSATLRCGTAETFAQWIRMDIGPAAAQSVGQLSALTGVGSFECRGRNGIPSAKLSEHGKANAIDIGVMKFRSGTPITLTDPLAPLAFREKVRMLACTRFTTVLGPGSDAYHNDHIHLDLVERAGGYRICQWDLSKPSASAAIPLPRPRPPNLKR
jgi:hypothetical protein